MPAVDRRRTRALQRAAAQRAELGREIREARLTAGVSLRAAASSVGMSPTMLGRIERGELRSATVEQYALACAAVGLELRVRAFPGGEPVRDRAQLALLDRFRAQLPPGTGWATEVPLPLPGDQRAWDCAVSFERAGVPADAEARLRDVQGLARRLALKMRDAGVDVAILVIADTAANRRALREYREHLRALLPLDTRAVLASLRAGRIPQASGIVII